MKTREVWENPVLEEKDPTVIIWTGRRMYMSDVVIVMTDVHYRDAKTFCKDSLQSYGLLQFGDETEVRTHYRRRRVQNLWLEWGVTHVGYEDVDRELGQ